MMWGQREARVHTKWCMRTAVAPALRAGAWLHNASGGRPASCPNSFSAFI